MTTALEPWEHVNAARNLYAESTAAFAAGRNLIGSELLWGAVAHSLIAAAQQRGCIMNITAISDVLPGMSKKKQAIRIFGSVSREPNSSTSTSTTNACLAITI